MTIPDSMSGTWATTTPDGLTTAVGPYPLPLHHVLGRHEQDARTLSGDTRRRVLELGVVTDIDAVPQSPYLEDWVLVSRGEDPLPRHEVCLPVNADDLTVVQHDSCVVQPVPGTRQRPSTMSATGAR
jgi:hypothetical protein